MRAGALCLRPCSRHAGPQPRRTSWLRTTRSSPLAVRKARVTSGPNCSPTPRLDAWRPGSGAGSLHRHSHMRPSSGGSLQARAGACATTAWVCAPPGCMDAHVCCASWRGHAHVRAGAGGCDAARSAAQCAHARCAARRARVHHAAPRVSHLLRLTWRRSSSVTPSRENRPPCSTSTRLLRQ